MSDEYETMGRGELLARLEDWMRVATDRGTRIGELEAERDRFDAALRLIYFHLGPPQPRVLDPADVAGLVEQAMADRDRLRVVVDIAREFVALDKSDRSLLDSYERLAVALAQLDVSPTGEGT